MGGTKKRLGILGGGQLGQMLCIAAKESKNKELRASGVETFVLDPSADCPAANVCSNFTQGDFRNAEDVLAFGEKVDVLTIEIEHVNTDALTELVKEGVDVHPSPEIISCIQDKGSQKQFYRDNQIPIRPPFDGIATVVETADEIRQYAKKHNIFSFVQKLCKGGYDGRGVFVVRSPDDLDRLLKGASVVERFVEIEKELSVIVAQNANGETVCFPPVEMAFNSEANLVEFVSCPASVSSQVSGECEKIAADIAKVWNLRGILAVEMFLSKDGAVIVNESAPRPHNSGHHTIEACVTSQYEQCLLAVLGLPLGDTSLKIPSVMVNILGEPGHSGDAVYKGLEESMKVEGANFHIYGKRQTKPFRKMGHVTVVDENMESAFEKARSIKQNLKVVS